MKKAHPFVAFKMFQKARAGTIRKGKNLRKEMLDGYVPDLCGWRFDFRHNHIAYCELRGRKREEIERKVRPDNKPDEEKIRLIKMYWGWSLRRYERIKEEKKAA